MQSLEPSLETLANRVAELEAHNRRLKKAGIASCIVAAAVIAMGQAPTKIVIVANEFVLQDTSGDVRARLSVEATDRPTLSFYNDHQKRNTAAFAGGDEPFLVLNRAGTNEEVQLGANKAFFGLGLYEKEIRAGLSVQKGVPGLELYNDNGVPQVTLELPSLEPFFMMAGPDNKSNLTLEVSHLLGGPGFTMSDSTGGTRVTLLTPNGEPSLRLEDKEGFSATFGSAKLLVPSTGRKESTSAASIALFGKDNTVLWSAP